MASIRLATFNVENLFARWRFRDNVDPDKAVRDGWQVEATRFDELSVDERSLTAQAILELEADVLCLQEVESVDTLKHFRATSLGGRRAYPYVAGIDGNDPRLIDVAVLSKVPVVHVRSHQHVMDPESPTRTLFSRDCLEVDLQGEDGAPLTLFVQHLKSMMGGREATRAKRERQSDAVRDIVTERFGAEPGGEAFAILGDFNDYPEADEQGRSGITALVEWEAIENVVDRLDEEERWTHFWAKEKAYKQLDYVLLSSVLAESVAAEPEIMRKGTPLRAERYTGERFLGVGRDRPKASDHCPVVVELELPS